MLRRWWGARRAHTWLVRVWLSQFALSLGLLWLAGIVPSYFCDLNNQSGGGIANQVACGLYRGARDLDLLVIGLGALAIATVGTLTKLAAHQRKLRPPIH